jgi:bifunctional UDP-N-acetylglucosamine pyrophosphorylase/glucosamine-1-phosphate N-acetyltransferase
MSAVEITVIVLAAGQGTRMKSSLPKVLHEIGGRPMLEHVLETAERVAGGGRIVAVFRPGMEEVAARYERRAAAAYQKEQLGTGDAVKAALAAGIPSSGVVLVLYADTPLVAPETLADMVRRVEAGAWACVAGFVPKDGGQYGRLVVGAGDLLERIVEHKDATDAERALPLCNSGVMALAAERLPALVGALRNDNAKGEYYLTDVVALARGAGGEAAYVRADEEEFLGVNDRIELAAAERVFQQRKRREIMLNGATLIAPETVFFSADTEVGRDVVVEPHVRFGRGVRIGDGARVRAFSDVEGAVLAEGCVVGPYARLRPGAVIGRKAKIGNFVEIKNADVGEGAKINHLSYVGDAEVGPDANVGAGVVTCNYDGERKHRTAIGAGAFVGSNCALVAPLTVGAGAKVGAGSVLTEDVPERSLALARARQTNKEGYYEGE